MLQINGLNKKFYKKDVLCDLSYTFEKGHIYSILGANGAGRTTLFECVSGDISFDSGDIKIEGDRKAMLSAKRESLPMYLTGYQFIKFLRDEPVKKVHVYQSDEAANAAEVIASEPADYDTDSEPELEDDMIAEADLDLDLEDNVISDTDSENVLPEEAEPDSENVTTAEADSELDSIMTSEAGQDSDEREESEEYDEIDQILALVKFDTEKKHLLIKDYDSKTRKKLQLAANLVKRPHIMMFDETLDYMDAKFIQDYIQVLESLKDDHIILVSTGVLDVAEVVPGDIVVLNNGTLNLLERESLEDEEVVRSVIKMLEEDEDE